MKYKIILASQSPRRRELLKNLGFEFHSINLDVDEKYPNHLQAKEITEYLAHKKSKYFGKIEEDNTILITADTIVWMEGKALEKPKNKEEAREMLKAISAGKHQVYTSVGFTTTQGFQVLTDCAEVHFLEITDSEIEYYVSKYNPLDKAGAYGIQDWIGLAKIDRIEGSYFSIMGFPTHIVYKYLQEFISNK